MSKGAFYFSHDYNARTDRKLIQVIMKHGMEGIGIYWCLIEMLYEEGGYMPLQCECIAFELRSNINIIKSIISDFDLFKKNDKNFWSESVLRRLEIRNSKIEKARNSAISRWNKDKNNANALRTQSECNAIKERKGKEIYSSSELNLEKKEINKTDPIKNHITQDMFNQFWEIYPRKDGKGKALSVWERICSRKNKERPTWIEIRKAIRDQRKSERWQDPKFIPMPATWLNQSRWIDDPLEMKSFNKEPEQYTELEDLPNKFK